jgi:hypothetical protein
MALAVASRSVRANQGVKLAIGLRGIAALGEWLTLHPELLEDLDTSDEKWKSLAEDPDFPIDLKRLLEAGANQVSNPVGASPQGTI